MSNVKATKPRNMMSEMDMREKGSVKGKRDVVD
jgi:hypothetical protein